MRQIVLDTETTGLDPAGGHRIIEIGAAEIVNRRLTGNVFHRYLNPDRDIDEGAVAVHGIRREDLETEPRFAEIADELLEFVSGAELIIHNASFDVGFIDHELSLMRHALPDVAKHCTVLDTLAMARELHPGQRNTLDALCRRYAVDNSKRDLHGALLDANLLADVYLAMTGGQATLVLETPESAKVAAQAKRRGSRQPVTGLKSVAVSADDVAEHDALLEKIRAAGANPAAWD